ncbi:hypothetical protein GTY41_40325 [Streptomyces sp. SID685]|uniref:hypothetical protein n=1 Tax=Streptomyces TaxID=1883 RepID=UPI00136E3927|nr:hypothetical protein [Streptomyces sp. SID685]MYR90998.1 hypothetical protein [Streptomyces sp. SID685]
MDTTHCAVDGWVDAMPVPGPRGTVAFDLVVRPADIDALADDAPDTVITCTSGDPRITQELLHDIQPGDLLHATGTLAHPPAPSSPSTPWKSWTPRWSRSCGRWCSTGTATTSSSSAPTPTTFTADGTWVGLADNPDAITILIDIHEHVNGGDA